MSKRDAIERYAGRIDPSTLPDVLTVPELCPILRCGEDAAYAFRRRHPGIFVKLDGQWRVRTAVLYRLLDRDPVIVAQASTDPYAKPEPQSPTPRLRVA